MIINPFSKKDIYKSVYKFFHPFHFLILLLFIILFFQVILGIISVVSIIPLSNYFLSGTTNISNKYVTFFFNFTRLENNLINISSIFLLSLFLSSLSLIVSNYYIFKINSLIKIFIIKDFVGKIFRLKWSSVNKIKYGVVANNITKVAEGSGQIARYFVTFVLNIILCFVYISIPFFIDFKFTLSFLLSITVILPFLIFIFKKIKIFSLVSLNNSNKLLSFISEFVQNLKLIIYSENKKKITKNLIYKIESQEKLAIKISTLELLLPNLIKPIALFFITVILIYYGSYKKNSDFAAILFSLYSFIPCLILVVRSSTEIKANMPYIYQYEQFNREFLLNKISTKGRIFLALKDFIVFENVSFGYSNSNLIFKNLNLKIYKNKIFLIKGKSGSGKSTLLDIIVGLNKPLSGRVLIDGKDLNKMNISSFRRKISYISQEPYLFDDTLKSNLIWSANNSRRISDKEIIRVLKLTDLYNYIKKLPLGINTQIGPRGIFLSGGQKQRLILARELIKGSSIILMDEPTSAIDNKSEKLLIKAIKKISKIKTFIIATHSNNFNKIANSVFITN
jgi:ABC-type multidrug transport system fused ATPase/permease subunit